MDILNTECDCVLLLQYDAQVVKYQQTDNITSTALFYVENALFYVVNFSNASLLFVDFDNLQIKVGYTVH